MKLTVATIENAAPRGQPYKLADGAGLTLLIMPHGRKLWRFRYRWQGREKMISLGAYPDTGLKLARDKRDTVRRQLAAGADPSEKRKAEKLAWANTFGDAGSEYVSSRRKRQAKRTTEKQEWLLREYLNPAIGKRPISSVTAADLLAALRPIEAQGLHETAHRALSLSGRVFRWAVQAGRAERDITIDLRGALAPVPKQHRAAITEPERIGALMRAIHRYQGHPSTVYALKLSPLFFVRPGELRYAVWTEFDLEDALWRIPGGRMKSHRKRDGRQGAAPDHLVPLATQAVTLLKELKVTGGTGLLFPTPLNKDKPISDAAVNKALRTLGFGQRDMSAHGFRAMARTVLDEVLGFRPDIIEHQLAHIVRDSHGRAYNRTQFMEQRREMIQRWADYLDQLRKAEDGGVE